MQWLNRHASAFNSYSQQKRLMKISVQQTMMTMRYWGGQQLKWWWLRCLGRRFSDKTSSLTLVENTPFSTLYVLSNSRISIALVCISNFYSTVSQTLLQNATFCILKQWNKVLVTKLSPLMFCALTHWNFTYIW